MDCTIKRILGETDEREQPEKTPEEGEAGSPLAIGGHAGPDDAEIDEVANLWTTGNKGEVMRRFMEMDNEKSVKLVFAIGEEGSLELARMVDQALEQRGDSGELGDSGEEGFGREGEASTEPSRVERPGEDEAAPSHHDNTVRELIGRPHVMPP